MYRKTILITLLCSALVIPSRAAIASRSSRDFIVVEPGALPELARAQAQAMMLLDASAYGVLVGIIGIWLTIQCTFRRDQRKRDSSLLPDLFTTPASHSARS